MPDVPVTLTLRGRRVQAWTRNGDAASLSAVTVLKGKPFMACEEQVVVRHVKKFLAKGRGDQDAWTTGGWCMRSSQRRRGK